MSSVGVERILGMLGLAMRAGKVIIGADMICRSMAKKTDPMLVLMSSSASEGTKKKITCKCGFYNVELIEIDVDTERLGHLLGKTYTPAAVAVVERGIAEQIKKANDALKKQ